jgi:hypothetical protein
MSHPALLAGHQRAFNWMTVFGRDRIRSALQRRLMVDTHFKLNALPPGSQPTLKRLLLSRIERRFRGCWLDLSPNAKGRFAALMSSFRISPIGRLPTAICRMSCSPLLAPSGLSPAYVLRDPNRESFEPLIRFAAHLPLSGFAMCPRTF